MQKQIKENAGLTIEKKWGGNKEQEVSDESKKTNIIEIFWTGGYDSTFRMVQLSRKKVIIRPYYISDARKSESYELSAIKKIEKALSERSDTKAVIEPVIVISMEMRHEYERDVYRESWEKINESIYLGSQYVWLAGFAEKHRGIELSVHKDDKAIIAIEKSSQLKKVNRDLIGDTYVMGKTVGQKNNTDIENIFENFSFPLAEYTKLKMRDEYIKLGYRDVMDCTWFCYRPVQGKPCGYCNPCMYTIEEGMKERFTRRALFMYHLKKMKKSAMRWN